MPAPRPALFLDRDGVINVDHNYVYRVEDFEWVEGARETIARFNAMGWWVFVVTNQSGIARGYYTEEQMQTLHDWITVELAAAGAHIDRIYHCPFHEDGTIARYTQGQFRPQAEARHADPRHDGLPRHQGAVLPHRRQAGGSRCRKGRRRARLPVQRRQSFQLHRLGARRHGREPLSSARLRLLLRR